MTAASRPVPATAPSPLDLDTLRTHLGPDADAFAFDLRAECDSTNSVLIQRAPADDGRVPVVACELQTAGRGRRGRQWQAWPGASLTFSAMWRFPVGAPVPAGLSLVAGIAVATVLENAGVAGVELKWPNDIQVHGRKLGGILVELASARQVAAVVGIGLNLSLPGEASIPGRSDVTALDQVIDDLPSREALLADLLRVQRSLFETYANSGFGAFQGAWNQRNAYADLPVRLIGETDSLEGICLGVDVDGALRLQTDTGVRRVLAGDVSLRAAG
ncbi:biotin--[acetyl-CoA-carboxylase] ligase [Denitromonas ohlonensis]|uniref:biotin--[biotin carboxyl-carrier protein] ligase n=2 Tax=Denitromonas TaxID=139331 RepID=A0A558CE13_9RHOO|nr:biotin--[acetyl-CoA-carboxylase] ligase [Denitromonas ohlonensis]TVO64788.1 biotin--[acetyl-CoA-carboxylase] ligase [Denitromonas ohlonensis]TVO70393.1 biotin--[acetyl-CoA-carboxylase] ligase [Denitromonas ohlonensis]TVT47010.1 MAG: biotin--[acetyl-CoA-carboxylase] ligase [Denitromonas halophila]TVT71949.1 MAG: biotin--[acetyl-CoA-carboxylase] ligase [Denitromonas halophila]